MFHTTPSARPPALLVVALHERALTQDRVEPSLSPERGDRFLSRGLAHVELSGDIHRAGEPLTHRVAPSVEPLPKFGRYLGPDGNGAIKVHTLSLRGYASSSYRAYAVVRYRDSA